MTMFGLLDLELDALACAKTVLVPQNNFIFGRMGGIHDKTSRKTKSQRYNKRKKQILFRIHQLK